MSMHSTNNFSSGDQSSDATINDEILSSSDYNPVSNANLLKDIEVLIQNMEQKHTQENESMMKNIENILTNIKINNSRPHSPQSSVLSNMSNEPIRNKSPIHLPHRDENRNINELNRNISNDVRNFVSNNIQEITPDLVNQVEQELFNDDVYDNGNDFLNDRLENERSISPAKSLQNHHVNDSSTEDEGLNEFLRNRHDVEFNERIISPFNVDRSVDLNDIEDFWRDRHDTEFIERTVSPFINTMTDHEAYLSMPENDTTTLIVQENETIVSPLNDEQPQIVEEIQDIPTEPTIVEENISIVETATPEQYITTDHDLETLKYKSSYNWKISQKPTKRNASERKFQKRNSLILENMLRGKQALPTKKSKQKAVVVINESNVVPTHNEVSSFHDIGTVHNGIEAVSSNVEPIKILQNFVVENVSTEVAERHSQNETQSQTNAVVRNQLKTPVKIIFNDGSEVAAVQYSVATPTVTQQSTSSFNVPITDKPEPSTSINPPPFDPKQQNLSELVEDTQRLIKQMKDEINDIYISDEDDYSSEDSANDYSDEWADGMEEENEDEYTDEESEYDDWSGDYIESEINTESTHEETLIEEHSIEDENVNHDEENSNLLDVAIANLPLENEAENNDEHNVVHAVLEITHLSGNDYKIGATSSSSNETESFINSQTDVVAVANETTTIAASIVNQVDLIDTTPSLNTNNITQAIEILPTTDSTSQIKTVLTEATNQIISQIVLNDSIVTEPTVAANSTIEVQLETTQAVLEAVNDSLTVVAEQLVVAVENEIVIENIASAIQNDVSPTIVNVPPVNNVEEIEVLVAASTQVVENPVEVVSIISQVVLEETPSSGSINHEPEPSTSFVQDPQSASTFDNVQPLKINSIDSINLVKIVKKAAADKLQRTVTNVDPKSTNKGAIAKTRIPEKVKGSPKTKSSAESSENVDEKDVEKNQIKIKTAEPSKTPADSSKKSNVSRKNSVETIRKNSIDNNPRKKSIPGPFGMLSSSNVKNLQKELLNKTSVPTPPKAQLTKVKPSKIVTPKVVSKDSTSTFANKLTKLITPSTSTKTSNKSKEEPEVDHSKSKIPKKKYIETCFSDDYQTSDDEDNGRAPAQIMFTKKVIYNPEDDETADVRYKIFWFNFINLSWTISLFFIIS